jgi:hypothetical protein
MRAQADEQLAHDAAAGQTDDDELPARVVGDVDELPVA